MTETTFRPGDASLLAPLLNTSQESRPRITAERLRSAVRKGYSKYLLAEHAQQLPGGVSLSLLDFHFYPQHVWPGVALHPHHRAGRAAGSFQPAGARA